MVDVIPEIVAVSVAFIACASEFVHIRRIRKIRNLAFGPSGKPAAWTWAAPLFRVVGMALASWGFASLWLVVEAQVHNKSTIDENDYKHLVLVVDVSPSMHLVDAGPDGNRSRRQRASDILESLFNRIPMQQFKISVIAVYSDAKMLLEDSSDHEVVRHIMEKMPMWHAYKPGKTKLMSGIQQAVKTARQWNPGSVFVVMLTDGDTVPTTGMPKIPASISEFLVVGVGDPHSGTFIDGHLSRQDVNTLRQVANRLHGTYHNGNKKHLPSRMAELFTNMSEQSEAKPWKRREWSLFALILGSSMVALIPVLLHYFGTAHRSGVPFSNQSPSAQI